MNPTDEALIEQIAEKLRSITLNISASRRSGNGLRNADELATAALAIARKAIEAEMRAEVGRLREAAILYRKTEEHVWDLDLVSGDDMDKLSESRDKLDALIFPPAQEPV